MQEEERVIKCQFPFAVSLTEFLEWLKCDKCDSAAFSTAETIIRDATWYFALSLFTGNTRYSFPFIGEPRNTPFSVPFLVLRDKPSVFLISLLHLCNSYTLFLFHPCDT